MTAPERDDEFEAFLKRRTLLPDMVDRLQPPDRLDEMVLNEARKAIRAERQPVRAARWARPVALAATILLCLSIVLNVTLNTNRPVANVQRMTAANAEKADKAADSAAVAPSAPPPVAATGRVAGGGAGRAATGDADSLVTKDADSFAAQGTAQTAAGGTGSLVDEGASRSVPAPRARRDAFAQNSVAASPPAAGAMADSDARRPGQPRPGPPQRASAAVERAGPPPSAMATASETRARDELRRELSASAPEVQGGAQAGKPATAEAPLPEQKLPQQALAKRKAEAQPPHPQNPKVWLQQIEALRSQGKAAQADAEMQRFRAAFPAYPIEPRRPDSP